MPVDGDIVLKAGLDSAGVTKGLNNLQKTISKGLKNAIRIGFGVRSVYALIRKLRSALINGFQNLAQVHQPFNDAVSQILTSLNLLKNSFAATFAPIIETVAPALSTFINLMANAVAKIGEFIAALTGKEYVRAGEVYIDYANSVSKGTKSSKSATEQTKKQAQAQKELNKEITHFDDLVILHDKDNDTDTSAATPAVTNPSYSFSTTPIGNAVSEFAEAFKSAWIKADFYDIGRIVGDKLKTALDNIPWSSIKSKLYLVAKSIVTFLNGFLETPGLFASIGTTIAQGVNSALTFVSSAVENFNWDSLGTAISDLWTNALNNLDWPLIKRTILNLGIGIGDAFRALFGSESLRQAVFTAASNFGASLALFLNSLITPENFAVLGDTLYTTIAAAFNVLATFGEKFDWGNFGVSLATGINSFLNRFSPMRLASGILTFIHGFHDTLVSFLSEVHWYDFGAKLSQLIKEIPWATLLQNIGDVIWKAINAAIETFKGIFNTDNITSPFTTAIDKLQDTVNRASELIDFQAIADGIKAVVDALAPAIEGFGVGFIAVFEALLKIGISFLSELGPALSSIADALNKVPPEVLTAIGTALGVIAGSLLAFNLVNSAIGLIATFATNLGKLVVPATNATTALMGGSGGSAAGGLALALGKVTVGLAAFMYEWEKNAEVISTSQDTYIDTAEIWNGLSDALAGAADEAGLTYVELSDLIDPLLEVASDDGKQFIDTMGQIETSLNDAGISSDSLKTALQSMLDSGTLSIDDAAVVESYIASIGDSADTSSQQTSDLQEVFGLFDDVSWTTGLKLALISSAIKALGDSGELSDEQSQELQKTLDAYNPNKPEKSMEKIQKAFENTGISAQDFAGAMATACINADTDTKKELGKVADSIKEFDRVAKENSETAAKNVGNGYTQTLESKTGESKKAGEKVVGASLDGMEDEGEMHSPSKATQRLGGYMGQGLFIGLEQQKAKLVTLAGTVVSEMLSAIEITKTQFTNAGSALMDSLATGVKDNSGKAESASNGVIATMYNSANKLNWWNVGYNIAVGIYNGLFYRAQWLETLAWNTAVRMYNAAVRALAIHSPSKKFAYIGEMITEGLGEGILDNQDNAVNAVDTLTDAVTDEAEKNSPTFSLSTSIDEWIDKLDDVLTKFSDAIVAKFDNMATIFAGLGNVNVPVPAVAQGKVVPASATTYGTSPDEVANMKGLLENITANQLTVDDLRPLLVEMFSEYMNFGWYVGDEQLARHANNGNLILGRRYSTIK